jgi:hypothetical protein
MQRDDYVFTEKDMVQPVYKILYLPTASEWETDFTSKQEAEAYLYVALSSFKYTKLHLFEIIMR